MIDVFKSWYQQNTDDLMVKDFGVFVLTRYIGALQANEVLMGNLSEMLELHKAVEKHKDKYPLALFVL